jgi:hypothetical protein
MTPNRRPEPLFDVDPRTGASIEVFYADRRLETFGRCGAGWFWCLRRRGCSPDGAATGPFATSYAAYRHAMDTDADRRLMHERLANRASHSMCLECDMEQPTHDDTWLESPVFTSIF